MRADATTNGTAAFVDEADGRHAIIPGAVPSSAGGDGATVDGGGSGDGGVPSKPQITVPGRHRTRTQRRLTVNNEGFCDRVLSALPEGLLYRSVDTAGQLVGEEGGKAFQQATPVRFQRLIDQHVELWSWTVSPNGRAVRPVYVNCNSNLAQLVHDKATDRGCDLIRNLTRIVQYPVYGPGFRRYPAGWSPDGTFFDCPPSLARIVPVLDPEVIKRVLEDLVVDFPFNGPADLQNFIGLLLTPILRPALDGNVPLHLVLASLERTGKSKLIEEVWGGVILGHPTPAQQFTGNDDEFGKRITSMLIAGNTLIHLDNLGAFIDSPVLASLMTSDKVQSRLLGGNVMVALKNTLIVAGSGNNVRATGEIVKRVVPIRLQPKDEHPENRMDFVHADLREHVRQVRPLVLGVLIGMVERWRRAGSRPGRRPLGGFEAWARVVGGVMAANGFEEWMANADEWRRQSNPDGDELRALVTEWARQYGSAPQTTTTLIDLCRRYGIYADLLAKAKGDASARTLFSRSVLARNLNAPVMGLRVTQTGYENNKTYTLAGDEDAFRIVAELPEREPVAGHGHAPGAGEEELPYFGG